MRELKKRLLKGLVISGLCLLLLGVLGLLDPASALAGPSSTLEITGDGVAKPAIFTRAQLEGMPQKQQVYSVVNTWPTKRWYVGEGVNLRELLTLAGIKEDARLLKLTSQDGYTMMLTVKELLIDKRYYFPHFNDNYGSDGDGTIPGSSAGAEPVEAIIALKSVEGSNNPSYMNDLNSFLFMMGQRAVTEQTGNAFVKYLNKIEVLCTEPDKWDSPQANPASGEVPAGSMVTLSNKNMDDDKIYYTTDGSTPDLHSAIYNGIAKRWWSARAEVLGIYNHPIGPINEGTVIKAITIGPGKENSDVATFSYRIAGAGKAESENGSASTAAGSNSSTEPGDRSEKPGSDQGAPGKEINFSDLKLHWAQMNIETLVAFGAVAGYPDGSFQPDKSISRAEFASILVKAFQLENHSGGGKVFADTATHWGKDYIAAAAASGVVNGYDAATFAPNELITREQMAVMISRAAKLALEAGELQFSDNDRVSGWARDALAAANKAGIMKGYPDNSIRPQGHASRAEAVTVIVNALNLNK